MEYVLFISSNPWRDHCLPLFLTALEPHLQGKIRLWFARQKMYLKIVALTWKEKSKLYLIGPSLYGRIMEEMNKCSKEWSINHPHCSNGKLLENTLENPTLYYLVGSCVIFYCNHFWYTLCLIVACEPQLYLCHTSRWYLTDSWVSE